MNIRISKEVEKALANNQAVVALESTIISHGMPYPDNINTALEVERIIRENGAIPATIGIIEGVGVIGLSKEEIEEFAKRKDILKASRRDLPMIFAKKLWAATTVASTMILANMAGIEVFVTGGIGGVHKGAEKTFDISADLEELAKTNVSVVCAGAKSILDLGLTLEYLETKGVPVLGYKTNKLPAFYVSESEFELDYNLDSPKEIAKLIKAKRLNKLDGGVVIANPIPKEFSLDAEMIDKEIEKALKEADKLGIKGKKVTPFLLSKIKDLTKGTSLAANIELVYNNARLGAKIAKELCE